MRGSPLVRALLTLVVVLALGWPLGRLTGGGAEREEARAAFGASGLQSGVEGGSGASIPRGAASLVGEAGNSSAGGDAGVELGLELGFSAEARFVELSHLGRVVWSKQDPARQERVALRLPFPKEGVELGVRVEWREASAGLSGVRLRLSLPEGEELERSAWGEGKILAVVPFP